MGSDFKAPLSSDDDLERAICTPGPKRLDQDSVEDRAASRTAPSAELAFMGCRTAIDGTGSAEKVRSKQLRVRALSRQSVMFELLFFRGFATHLSCVSMK